MRFWGCLEYLTSPETFNRTSSGGVHGYAGGFFNSVVALSNSYKDESGAVYSGALDGYTLRYGNQEQWKMTFRRGYVEGYKAGWDFNSGQYNPLGGGGGRGAGG
jgi:hypothetical protein